MSPHDAVLVRDSGLFDARFYLEHNADALEAGDDPVEHFCGEGWQELRKPRRDFDVWWYWTTYLDPRESDVNPFVHYLRSGRVSGFTGVPSYAGPRTVTPLPTDRAPRRACLFAAFDADAVVDPHVVRYVEELSRHADVFFLHDGYLPDAELAKVAHATAGAWAVRHGAYDFGSYAMLARDLVGWQRLEQYDEVLFVNDSCYLLGSLDEVFSTMAARPCAWWGLQATKGIAKTREAVSNAFDERIPVEQVRDRMLPAFEDDAVYDFLVGSYFTAYRGDVVRDAGFRAILDSVAPGQSKLAVIQRYEIGLTHHLVGRGFEFDTFVPYLYPFHPVFGDSAFDLVREHGFPLLKRYLLYQNHYDVPGLADWKARVLESAPDAPVEMFEQHLRRSSPLDRLSRSFAVSLGADGDVVVPDVLTGGAFRRADRATPKDPSVWAFPVSPLDHVLPDNSRAILAQVRDDPSITKVVLTRSRPVEVSGTNVHQHPLQSPEGQQALWRSGHVFVQANARRTVGEPLSKDHLLYLVHGYVDLWTATTVLDPPVVTRHPTSRWHAVLAAAEVDRLGVLATYYPTTYDQVWSVGTPVHDLLLAEPAALPPEVAEAEARVRGLLDGRRLVLLVPQHREPGGPPSAWLSADDADRLVQWAHRHEVALGVREDLRDLDRAASRLLQGTALDLHPSRHPVTPAVLRAADAVVTDYAGVAVDFTVTGRPALSFAPDLDEVRDRLLHDLEAMFPGPVCRDAAGLTAALDEVLDPAGGPSPRHREVTARYFGRPDGRASERVVQRVRTGALPPSPVGAP